MEIPLSVLKIFNLFKNPIGLRSDQKTEREYCPIGCDRSRTKLAISKVGKKDKGNFVRVYYRNTSSKKTVAAIQIQDTFRREHGLVERITNTSNSGKRKSVQTKQGPKS